MNRKRRKSDNIVPLGRFLNKRQTRAGKEKTDSCQLVNYSHFMGYKCVYLYQYKTTRFFRMPCNRIFGLIHNFYGIIGDQTENTVAKHDWILGQRSNNTWPSKQAEMANAAIILWQVTYAAEKARTGFCPDDQPASFCYLATAFSD